MRFGRAWCIGSLTIKTKVTNKRKSGDGPRRQLKKPSEAAEIFSSASNGLSKALAGSRYRITSVCVVQGGNASEQQTHIDAPTPP
jgi:hypothetical protein